uniref:hypothetical protein n=1 Tax=Vibrio lentus TaxID=136468 RepID=UPI001CEFBE33
SQRISVSIVLGMVLVMVLLLAKQIITLYHAVQKTLTKDQHALVIYVRKALLNRNHPFYKDAFLSPVKSP